MIYCRKLIQYYRTQKRTFPLMELLSFYREWWWLQSFRQKKLSYCRFRVCKSYSEKKANRAARKLLTVEANVVNEKEDIKLSGHLGGNKSINNKKKKLCNIEAKEKREEKLKLVHVLHDVIIPSNCFKCVTA